MSAYSTIEAIAMYTENNEQEFQGLLTKFKTEEDLYGYLKEVGYEDLFSYEFLALNSDFSSLDDIIYRSGFGIMSPLEIGRVPTEKWDEYIAGHTDKCRTWHEFGKLAMTAWMKKMLQERALGKK
jgi:hypothetical protein